MFPKGVIRLISVDEQPLFQYALQQQFQNLPEFELSATSSSLVDIEPLIRQHQPHIVILETHFLRPPEADSPSLAARLHTLRQDFPGPTLLLLASRLDPSLLPHLEPLDIRGYLLKHDPCTLHLPEIVRALHLGGYFYSEEVLQAQNALPEPLSSNLLTARQVEILQTIVAEPNCSYAQYTERLGIAKSTWDSHLCNIYARLGVNNMTAAILCALELGVLPLSQRLRVLSLPDMVT
ncbi:MAG: LuxR C-terminal-related transcriptional regulator [Anaerolineales bacterium]